MIFIGISCLMMGPFPLFFMPRSLIPTIIAMVSNGFAQGFSVVPVIAEVQWVHQRLPDKDALNDYSCSLFSAFYGIGDFIGPLLGNFLYLRFGFAFTSNLISMLCIGFGILYILMCWESETDVTKTLVIWSYSDVEGVFVKDE